MKNVKTNRIDKLKLIEHYNKTKNAMRTAEEFGLSGPTVLKIVRSFNVPVHGEHKHYTDDYIVTKYHELGTVEKTGIHLGIGDQRIIDVLEKNNIERKKIKHIEVGNVYHKLTVLEFVGYRVTSGGEKCRIFLCSCECGGTREVNSSRLTSLKDPIKDCGCGWNLIREKAELKRIEKAELKRIEKERIKQLRLDRIEENKRKREQEKLNKKPPTEKKFKVGYKHHRLTIISEIGKSNDKIFTVECECGTIKEIKRTTISLTKSCGCLQKEKSTTHGNASRNRKWYDRWRSMIKRCYNPKTKSYPNYGGRGIKVCDRWIEPNGIGCENYYNDIHEHLGPQPSPEHSLDRIDNDGMYEITNMRWATNSEQQKNQRRNLKS